MKPIRKNKKSFFWRKSIVILRYRTRRIPGQVEQVAHYSVNVVLCTIIYGAIFIGSLWLLYTRIVGPLKEFEDYIYLCLSLLAVLATGGAAYIIYRQNVKKNWHD